MAAKLSPVPNPAPKLRAGIALIRVSKERDGMISPENQRYSIEQYAERENIRIIEWVEGIDESGSRKKSAWWARLDYAVEQVEAKRADVLLVWRIDRTARSRVKWAVATDRIETAGGYIESATEPNDRTPAGRFGRGVMAEHAAFMAESIGATWKETLESRVRRGLTPNGARHYGYAYENGTYGIHPTEGATLAKMYHDYIAGISAWAIAARLTDPTALPDENGIYPRYSRWSTAAVLRLLDSGFGAGYILFRGELHPGIHDPVITEAEWILYQHTREQRRRRPRAERSPYPYSGIIYCHCGSRMGGRLDHGKHRYGCTAAIQYPSRKHPNASISATIIDDAIAKWLPRLRDRLNEAAANIPRKPTPVKDPVKDVEAKMSRVLDRIDSATMKMIDETIPQDAYQRIKTKLDAEYAVLAADLKQTSARATVMPIAFVGDLTDHWSDLAPERQREALRMLVDKIVVNPPNTVPRVVIDSPHDRS